MQVAQRHAARAAEAGRHWEPRGGWQARKPGPLPLAACQLTPCFAPSAGSHIPRPAAPRARSSTRK